MTGTMQKHFVTFYSPGTFIAEMTEEPIDSWDVKLAEKRAKKITERYNAKPYGFSFSTRSRNADELDSKVTATSHMYYLSGKIETLAEIKAREPAGILFSNMQCNNWNRIITCKTPYPWTQPLEDGDVVLHEE